MTENFHIGKHSLDLNKTWVMGILNVTPDSFSDGGSYVGKDKALKQAEKLILDGAAIIDVGGESTRPGYKQISEEEEISRVVPVIQAIRKEFDIPLSVDTCKAKVARASIKAGADMVNDIWGLKGDFQMTEVIRETGASVCIMHNRREAVYQEFTREIMEDLKESLVIAERGGIKRDKIIIDPGVGFGKTYEMNLWCIGHLEKFLCFDLPVLLGASRKSVIGNTLNLPVEEREEGTIATTVMAVMKGCHFVRVHNAAGNVRAIQMTEAAMKGESGWIK